MFDNHYQFLILIYSILIYEILNNQYIIFYILIIILYWNF